MNTRSTRFSSAPGEKHSVRSRDLIDRWRDLCARYLPVRCENSVWRLSRNINRDDPSQGWKLHVSATVLNAHRVLEKVAPLLIDNGALFKAPVSLVELMRINSGLEYSYSQVGKIITVYPQTEAQAVTLARRLHRLTRRISAPHVPFDLQFRPASNVFYRYGSFSALDIENPDGTRTPAVRDSEGNLVPDLRAPGKAKPEWVQDPFRAQKQTRELPPVDNPLASTYRVFRALIQRGKGGVYQAVDLSVQPPRLCLIKEGRRSGEVGLDGRDGRWRVKNEERVLSILRERGVGVPRVYSSFGLEGNHYIVCEFIDGESLHHFLYRRHRRLSITRALEFGIQLSTLIADIHAAGWVWRDCKPSNLLVTKKGTLRPLDFEGACEIRQSDSMSWVTPPFTHPRHTSTAEPFGVNDDLYALGAVIYLLLTGRMPDRTNLLTTPPLRPNTPQDVCELLWQSVNPATQARPPAQEFTQRLRAALSSLQE